MTVVLKIRTHHLLHQMMKASSWALLLVMASVLAWCVHTVSETRQFQREHDAVLIPPAVPPVRAPVPAAVSEGGLIGRVELPRIGISTNVMEGSDDRILRLAAGHVTGTRLPGENGNTVISAHRDTFFRPLRNIQRDDVIRVTTLEGEYSYRVASTKIVNPTDVEVLDSDESEVLTLVTCYPFYYVGSAPQRFIVRAERIF